MQSDKPRKMLYARITFTLAVLFVSTTLLVAQGKTNNLSVEKCEAEKAWETLIRTKGGREKLHSITAMLTQFSDVTRLNVFPDREWDFAHFLDMSLSLAIYDGRRQLRYLIGENGPESIKPDEFSQACDLAQIPFLLETKWCKPEPLHVVRESAGKKKFDVIETIVDGDRIDFVYEPEEMLVSEVRLHYRSDDEVSIKYRLYNYRTIDGIKMPGAFRKGTASSEFKGLKKNDVPIKFEFNVDYDPKIFEPPFRATTADAWRRKQ